MLFLWHDTNLCVCPAGCGASDLPAGLPAHPQPVRPAEPGVLPGPADRPQDLQDLPQGQHCVPCFIFIVICFLVVFCFRLFFCLIFFCFTLIRLGFFLREWCVYSMFGFERFVRL